MGNSCSFCLPFCPCCAFCCPPQTKGYVDVDKTKEDEIEIQINEKEKLLSNDEDEKLVEPATQSGLGSFIHNYSFNTKQTIILQHFFGDSLTISDSNNGTLTKNGNYNNIAQWSVELHGKENDVIIVKFKNKSNGKYLRIIEKNDNKITDCLGTDDKFSHFKLHQSKENLYKFESTVFKNNYIGVNENFVIVNNGDKFSNFSIWSDEKDIKPIKGNQSGDGIFTNSYEFNCNNKKVIMKHYYGKTLCVHIKNENNLNSNGNIDNNAQFCIEFDGNEDIFMVVKLKNIKTGKYVRIVEDKIHCLGNGGKYTRFKVHKCGDNLYKFESCVYKGKYISVEMEDVMIGNGNDVCEFTLWSDEKDEIINEIVDNKEEIKSEEVEEDSDSEDRRWYDNIEEISSYIKKENKKNKSEELVLSVEYWQKMNKKKWIKLDQILMELQEFVGVTNFDLRMTLWERVDDKRKKMNTLQGLEKLLYQVVIEYINQKDKKRTKPLEKNVKTFMQYLAKNMIQLENFPEKQKKEMGKEVFARGIDNWVTAMIEKYKGE